MSTSNTVTRHGTKAADVYQAVTDRLIAEIESGIANPSGWRKPWADQLLGHRNATTSKPYLGFNQVALMFTAADKGYSAPVWATYKQWGEIGAQVRKGEKATHLVKWVSAPCKHGPDLRCAKCNDGFPMGFAVFNAAQVDGYTYTPIVSTEHERLAAGEAIVAGAKADGLTIRHLEGANAYYERSCDMVTLPSVQSFLSSEDYYATTLHELAHASGHENRLDRAHLAKRFGDSHYAVEELVAEFAAAFLCTATGIPDSSVARHGDYLASWVRVLRGDSKALAHAASQAQKAASYWLDRAVTSEEVAA